MRLFLFLLIAIVSCGKSSVDGDTSGNGAYRITKTVTYDGVSVDVVIDKPANDELDVLLVYHGTVWFDDKILEAANNALNGFKRILDRDDMMIASVVYPEENLLIGDNIAHSEAALLWMKNRAENELGITINKIFLAGHSQGGYLVTRLNTMHETHGVVANAPGPLNLIFRCQLEEEGRMPAGIACTSLRNAYGTTASNPDAYFARSLLNFTDGFLGEILFVQGLDDSPIQMHSWPVFKQQIEECTDCREAHFLDLPGYGHNSLFQSSEAAEAFNQFLMSR